MATVTLAFCVFSKADAGIVDLVGMSGLERRWTLLGAYVLVLAFPVIRGMLADIVRLVANDTLLLGIGGLAALSILWSPQPTPTFNDVVSLALTIAVAAYLAARFDARTLAALLFAAMVIAASLSVLTAFIRPELGLHTYPPHIGTLRGLYIHKNILGQATAIGAIPGTLLVLDGLTRRRWWTIPAIAGLALIIAVLWMADSRTSQTSLVFSLGVTFGFKLLRRGPDRLADAAGVVLGVTTLGMTGLLASGVIAPISTLLGRSRTMFARLEIWAAAFDVLDKQYWLGLGFESFWVEGSPTRQAVETTVGWAVSSAHNGYIDVVLGLGLVGLLLFSTHLIRTCFLSARLAQRTQELEPLLPMMIVALVVMANLAESLLLAPGLLLFVNYLVCNFWTDPEQGRYGQRERELSLNNW
jgi:O-antigen ligase